jgi:hypothetical protein
MCNLLSTELASSIRRIHHPSGAAPPGTPVRARFCMAVDFANSNCPTTDMKTRVGYSTMPD